MKLSIREKLALQRRNKELIQQLKEEKLTIRQKLQMQSEVSSNFKKLKAKVSDSMPEPAAEPPAENELLNKYLAGGFNEQPAEKLFEVIDQLDAQGVPLQQIKTGAITWVTANADLKAA